MQSRSLIFLTRCDLVTRNYETYELNLFFSFCFTGDTKMKFDFYWIYGLITHPIKNNDSTRWPCKASAIKFDMIVQTFVQCNSQLVHGSLLTEILSMHKWDYNHRRAWLLWSFIQYIALLQATSWHFFQVSPDVPFLTNDASVGIDRLPSAVYSVFRRLIALLCLVSLHCSSLVLCNSLFEPYWLFSFLGSGIWPWWETYVCWCSIVP